MYIWVKCLLEQEKKGREGPDFVHGELIGWLWFAIGWFHVSDRLPRPPITKHIIREEKSCKMEGRLFWIKITRHEFKKMMCTDNKYCNISNKKARIVHFDFMVTLNTLVVCFWSAIICSFVLFWFGCDWTNLLVSSQVLSDLYLGNFKGKSGQHYF